MSFRLYQLCFLKQYSELLLLISILSIYTIAIDSNKNTSTVIHWSFWLNLIRVSSRRVVSISCETLKDIYSKWIQYTIGKCGKKRCEKILRKLTELETCSHWRSTSMTPPLLKYVLLFFELSVTMAPLADKFTFKPMLHFNRCCSTLLFWVFCNEREASFYQPFNSLFKRSTPNRRLIRSENKITFHISAISCWDAFKSFISMHMTKNLSLFSSNVMFGPGCNTTLIFALLPGGRTPVLGRTRNFSGDVVLIWMNIHELDLNLKLSTAMDSCIQINFTL